MTLPSSSRLRETLRHVHAANGQSSARTTDTRNERGLAHLPEFLAEIGVCGVARYTDGEGHGYHLLSAIEQLIEGPRP
jgi:hypothetical protein